MIILGVLGVPPFQETPMSLRSCWWFLFYLQSIRLTFPTLFGEWESQKPKYEQVDYPRRNLTWNLKMDRLGILEIPVGSHHFWGAMLVLG